MRLFAFSDYHNGCGVAGVERVHWRHEAFASHIDDVAPDVIISAGDHTYFGQIDLAFYTPLRTAASKGSKVFCSMGNHEDGDNAREFQEQVPGAVNIDGKVEHYDGVCFYGWNAFADFGRDSLIRAEARIQRLAELVDQTGSPFRVLVSHEAPREYVPPNRHPVAVGDPVVSRLVEITRPTLVVTGHYHCHKPHEQILETPFVVTGHYHCHKPHEQILETPFGCVRIVNPGPGGVVLEIGAATGGAS